MTVDLHGYISQPGDGRNATVLVFGLHAEEGQPRRFPARPSQQVGTGPLKVVEQTVEGVVVRVAEHYAGTGACGLAEEGSLLLLAGLQLATLSVLAEHLVVHVQAATSLRAAVRQPEDLPSSVKTT